jgi:cold shock protein
MNGTIKKLVTDKGFGFISAAGMEKDVFFHSKSLDGAQFNELSEGQEVTFEIEDTPKGKSAINVKLA